MKFIKHQRLLRTRRYIHCFYILILLRAYLSRCVLSFLSNKRIWWWWWGKDKLVKVNVCPYRPTLSRSWPGHCNRSRRGTLLSFCVPVIELTFYFQHDVGYVTILTSVRPSPTVCNVEVSWSRRLEYFQNIFTTNYHVSSSLPADPTSRTISDASRICQEWWTMASARGGGAPNGVQRQSPWWGSGAKPLKLKAFCPFSHKSGQKLRI